MDIKTHWENIYATKRFEDTSWYQSYPNQSIAFVEKMKLDKDAAIIDIGGGDSFFVDALLNLGFTDITVLDISEKALVRARQRLGGNASRVEWIVSDIVDFKPIKKYDFWHDRAAFHFLDKTQVKRYTDIASKALILTGNAVIATFSDKGPQKCSGIDINQYNAQGLESLFEDHFELIECLNTKHQTPKGQLQDFLFCHFQKI